MRERHWAVIWHQAITCSFMDGRAFGREKTVVFTVTAPAAGDQLRMRFSNRLGSAPYQIGGVNIVAGTQCVPVTLEGERRFSVPAGGVTVSDPVALNVETGEKIQIRLYYLSRIRDNNMIEPDATLLRGDHTVPAGADRMCRPLLAKILGAYNGIPSLEAVELHTEMPCRAVVAFGDSITALSRWTKPLADRLAETYPGQYALLNSGISGNCLLYEVENLFGPVFGEKGTDRFSRDVLEIPGLDTVILGLGVNDVSYLSENTAGQISLEQYRDAVTSMTEKLHARGVRVVIQTVTPRLGVSRIMGKYSYEMEELRLAINDWIRSAGIFDYVFDAEAVVRQLRPDGFYYGEGLHRGDHLHPSAEGGRKLAGAFDLAKLTGKEP